jgi:hypothetical protein
MTTFNLDMLFKCTALHHVTFKIQGMAYGIVRGQLEGLSNYPEITFSVESGKELQVKVVTRLSHPTHSSKNMKVYNHPYSH